jgi:hypothetical protein
MRPIAACANVVVERTRVSQVTPEITQHSPRNGFNGFLRALPGDRALLPPSLAECSANLTPASGCQDHTPSPSASVPFVNGTSTSTASHPASVTIAIRPSSGTRQWAYTTDLGRTASIISEIPKLGAVARMEPTGRRKAPPDGAIRDSTRAAKIPEFAEPVIGRAFARPVGSVRATTLDGILVICPSGKITGDCGDRNWNYDITERRVECTNRRVAPSQTS